MKRVILSGGGTGGHIYPAITIGREIASLTEAEFLYVGTDKGLEANLVPKEGFPFRTLPVQGLRRSLSVQNLVTLGKSMGSVLMAMRIISDFKPDVVIGTGGYVCGPMLLAASLRHIPTLIQEQNVIAGITNKILSRFVDVVAVGYEEAEKAFPKAKRVVYTGNPVRPDVLIDTREMGRQHFNLADDDFAVLIAGGSRGARSINTAMLEVHRHFKDQPHIKLIHVTGQQEYDSVLEQLGCKDGQSFSQSSLILPYLHDMPKGLAAADLAVFRAGAVGLAELTVRGIPSILIPYPYAAEDHQTYNARALVSAGAARLIIDRMLTGQDLISEIEYFKTHREELAHMAAAAKGIGRPQAARDLAELALEIAK